MQRIKFALKQFLYEPLWFKILISTTLLISVIFSSSFFSSNAYFQSCSKLAAAIFFFSYGVKMRRNFIYLSTNMYFSINPSDILVSEYNPLSSYQSALRKTYLEQS